MPTPHQLAEARRRLDLVEAIGRHSSLRKAAEALGESVANLCRYRQAYEAGGRTLEALVPDTHLAGRPRAADTLAAEEIAEARRALLKTESLPLALEHLADSDLCSHATRELLLRYRDARDYPPSIVAAVRFTEEEWAAFRGQMASQGSAYTTRRGMWIVEADGTRRELFAGDIVEADDVSTDVPYFVKMPDGSVRVGRQILVFRDVRSRKYLYAAAIARTQDSYRAEDIVRACRWLVEAHGLPGRFRFERGSWASAAIDGHECPVTAAKWGGIAQIVPVTHTYSSNGKTIEGGFRLFHQVMGLHGVRIGKTRGEYEQPSADMLAVNAGRKDPAACGFIPWEGVLKAVEDTFTKINGRATWDRHTAQHTTPDDMWWADMQARPGKRLPVCPPELFDHFLPVKRLVSVGAVQAGHVQVSLPDYPAPFVFRCAGYDAEGKELPYLERLHKVWVGFDPHEVAATGATIYNAEASDSTRNRGGYRPLERLFTAPLSTERPQIDLRPAGERGEDADIAAKKLRTAQVRAVGTSIGAFGQGARRVHHSSDAQGTVSRMESGAAPRSPAPRAEAAPAVQAPRKSRAVIVEDLDAAPVFEAPARAASVFSDLPASGHRHPASAAPAREPVSAVHYEDI
jgi:hypothetical protein